MTSMANALPKRRWFSPTPGWLVLGLLAVEGLLFLAEQFRWLPKGWTVLVAVASVGVALILMLAWFAVALLFRWRFQFSIRSLLVLTVAVALPFSWLAARMRQAAGQQRVVQEIEAAGGLVVYDFQLDPSGKQNAKAQMPEPAWLRDLLGDDYFHDILALDLRHTGITDEALPRLAGLTCLKHLDLQNTEVSDAGLEHLKGLSRLEGLDLRFDDISDRGLQFLEGLPNLRSLALFGTGLSDEEVAKRRQAIPTCTLDTDSFRPTVEPDQDSPRDVGAQVPLLKKERLAVLTELWMVDEAQYRVGNIGWEVAVSAEAELAQGAVGCDQ